MTKIIQHKNISSVLLVGGTHGNELTGIHLVRHWQMNNFETQFNGFSLNYLIANPLAIKANKRYIDHDLNRCFKQLDLDNPLLDSCEQMRAKQINSQFGPKGDTKVDFIIDLHTSTANMQTNIVLTRIDTFHLQLAAYLKSVLPDVVITSESDLMDDHHFLESIAPKGVLIEIGPIPQGSIEYPCFETTQNAVKACLEFVAMANKNSLAEIDSSENNLERNLEIMSYFSKIFFPTDDQGDISASVHPDLVGKAYPILKKGDPLFKSFSGKDLFYQGETAHVAFINEAAYYDQKIAMCLCRPNLYSVQSAQLVEQN